MILQICQTRRTTVFHDIAWPEQCHGWPGLKAVVMVESERWTGPKIEREARFYITSSAETAQQLGTVIRRQSAVESMHWPMD